jgi:predicted ATPase/DNA-binding SARP family transcriptional activator
MRRESTGVRLSLLLFGRFEAQVCGVPLPPLRTRKGEQLLSLLALRAGGRPRSGWVERRWLAGLLWPDSSDAQSLRNLRTSLADLRQALGPEADRLHSPTSHALCLDLSGAAVDVLTFDQAIRQGDTLSLKQAIALYRGPLLEDCTEEWVFQERQARLEVYLTALETLAAQALMGGDAAAAERHLRRAVAADPLRETAQRALMQALAASGNYAAAMLAYRELRLRLHREINAEPDAETDALFQQLRAEARGKAGDRRQAGTRFAGPRLSPGPVTHNLPRELSRFIGREQEMAAVKRLLETTALLTLTGSGGCGKTRLALRVAAELVEKYSGGVWLVELAALSDPSLVPQTIATALGVREEPGRPIGETVTDYLRPRQVLLLLDNCEHLLADCAAQAEALLRSCPGVRILATSREGLNISGETTYRLPSLSLPPVVDGRWSGTREAGGVDGPARTDVPSPGPSTPPASRAPDHPPSTLLQSEAAQLFIDRARTAAPLFRLTDANAPAIAQICHRLDGIPLAIELAAARVKALTAEKLNERLDDLFGLLTGGSRTALPRQQTLRALIDWSYDLLSEPEQALLRRLSVFAGGWTLEAAEAVVSGQWLVGSPAGSEPESPIGASRPLTTNHCPLTTDVLGLLISLVEKSLVLHEPCEGEGRYRLLETVRQYAQDRLTEAAEAGAVRRRHRDWFLALAKQAEPEFQGREQMIWLERLEREHDNLRAALAWCQSAGDDGELGLPLGAALGPFWLKRSYLAEGWGQLARLLAMPAANGPLPADREDRSDSRWQLAAACARAQACAGVFALHLGNFDAAGEQLEESLARGRALDDRPTIALALSNLGVLAQTRGHLEVARERFAESLAMARDLGDERHVATLLVSLAGLAHSRGDVGRAHSLYQEGRLVLQALGDVSGAAWAGAHLGGLALILGDTEAARSLAEESLTLFRALDDPMGVGSSLHLLGRVGLAEGSPDAARTRHEEALRIAHELGSQRDVVASLLYLGDVSLAELDLAGAADFYEQGLAISRELDYRPGIADALRTLGTIAHRRGDSEAARALYLESLAIRREQGERAGLPDCLEGLAAAVGAQGQPQAAARLLGAADSLRVVIGTPVPIEAQADYDRSVAGARDALGEEAFAAAWAEGRAMSLEQAIRAALAQEAIPSTGVFTHRS